MKANVYTMARRPVPVHVKRRVDFDKIDATPIPEIVAVDKFTECHVTPPDVAARMVRYLGEPPAAGGWTLEPSAGTGNLSRALVNAGYTRIQQVERHIRLSQGLSEFGGVANQCFLEFAAEMQGRAEYLRVIMNPPFRDVRNHVAAARRLLWQGHEWAAPCLVALVPVTFQADEFETLEHLGPDTFATAKVHTKIIRISHP